MYFNARVSKLTEGDDTLAYFVRSYTQAALFAGYRYRRNRQGELESEGGDLRGEEDRITWQALREMVADCPSFLADNLDAILAYGEQQAAHDFYFTRNGHGVGFWEGDRGTPGSEWAAEILDANCRPYGTQDLEMYGGYIRTIG